MEQACGIDLKAKVYRAVHEQLFPQNKTTDVWRNTQKSGAHMSPQ